MTALGKIMVVFVFLLSLVWAYFVANSWATRTNWKAEADKQNKIAKDNYDGAKAITEQAKADRSAADAKTAALQASVDRMQQQLIEERAASSKLYAAYEAKLQGDRASAKKVDELALEIEKLQKQIDLQLVNLKTMEADLNAQIRVTEANKNLKDEAVRTANAEKDRAERARAQLVQLSEELAAAKLGGKSTRPIPPEGFRGTVKSYGDNLIEITPGLNAGLKEGMQLMIRRTVGNKNYIGTITIGAQIDPDRAVGTWTMPFSVKKPAGDDFPKAGDEIVPLKN